MSNRALLFLALLFPLGTVACDGDDPVPEVCDDGEDNDGDGDTDCADSSCASSPACDTTLIARDDDATTEEDTALVLAAATLLDNDSGVGLEITEVGAPTSGTVALDGTTVTFTPAADFSGAASFTYTVEAGGDSATATVRITVTAVDDAPVANDDAAAMREDTVRIFGGADLLGNDVDVDSPVLTIESVAGAVNGTAVLTGGNVTFTPTADFTGTASFDYTVSDGTSTDTATVTITVIGEDDPPVVVDDAVSTDEDTAVVIPAAALLGNDSDPDGALVIESVQGAVNGTVELDGTDVTFTPAADFFGTASFTYTAGDGESSDTATVTVTVNPIDDPPVAGDDAATTDEDVPVTIPMADLLVNDVDVDDDEAITSVQDPVNGSVAIVGSDVVFTPDPDFSGEASFTYTLTGGALTDDATVTVTVTEVPECQDGGPDPDEECDDGNGVDGDGCDNDCTYTCGSGAAPDTVVVDPVTGHCYAAFDGDAVTWAAAEAFCEGLGGYLPVVADDAEDDLIAGLPVAGDNPWLGGHDPQDDNTFQWVNGDAFTFTAFTPGQPDDGFGNEDCLHFWQDAPNGPGWNDTNCDIDTFVTGVVCEVEPESCGDSVVQAGIGEECDDGNSDPEDGCSATCQLEPRLVINEVDYDQPSSDTLEFVEIYNAGPGAADLTDYVLVAVNGSGSLQYNRWDLSASGETTLAPGAYLVIANALVVTPPGTARIDTPLNSLQNGAPDGLGLFRFSDGTLIDALSYEGEITAADTDFGFVNLVEGTAATALDDGAIGSLIRSPDGADTDDADADWSFNATATPGAANP